MAFRQSHRPTFSFQFVSSNLRGTVTKHVKFGMKLVNVSKNSASIYNLHAINWSYTDREDTEM
jgi:hypothetical protein